MPTLHALFYLPDAKEGDFPREFSFLNQQIRAHRTDSETFAQCTHTRSATTETLKNAGAIATVGIRMIMDRPWAQTVRLDWEANMASLDGHKVRAKIEQVFESYPLNKDVDRMVCACH